MLQTLMKIVRPNRTVTATYRADSNEVNTNGKGNIVDKKVANVQSMKMAIWLRNVKWFPCLPRLM